MRQMYKLYSDYVKRNYNTPHAVVRADRLNIIFLSKIKRAFSLIEIIGVIALIAIISIATYATLSGSARPGGDTAAKTSLVIFSEIQSTAFVDSGIPASITLLQLRNTSINWQSSISTSPTEVQVIYEDSATAAAASTGEGSCWFIRLDATPGVGQEPVVWAVADQTICDATVGMELQATGNEIGRNPNNPQILGGV